MEDSYLFFARSDTEADQTGRDNLIHAYDQIWPLCSCFHMIDVLYELHCRIKFGAQIFQKRFIQKSMVWDKVFCW